jgi:hypothetical protein
MPDGTYGLEGYDTFSGESYGLDGSFETCQGALEAADARLQELERTQPTSSSGGQRDGGFQGGTYVPGGIQDRVYIVHPDGRRQRVFPTAQHGED